MKNNYTLFSLLVCLISFSCASMNSKVYTHAKQTKPLEENMSEVAKDLASLHNEIQAIYLAGTGGSEFENMNLCPVSVTITGKDPKIFKGADTNADIITIASMGQKFKVVDKVNDWYAVSLSHPTQGFDSGWVKASQVVAEPISWQFAQTVNKKIEKESLIDRMYKKIMDSVITFREKYEKNPYIKVSGFSVDISFPPSVSIAFEFK